MKHLKIIIIVWLLALSTALMGQYNEKDILNQQASQLLAQRQYTQAEQIYRQILDKYPNDLNSILQLLNIYFSLTQTDKAETLLNQYRRNLPEQIYTEQHILLLVMQAKVPEAWQESLAYLNQYGADEYKYRRLAAFYERKGFYDKELVLYRMARRQLNNPELFRLEIANTCLNYRMFGDSIKEYLAYLDKNPVNLFFTNNQLKTILQEDSTLIAVIANYADSSGTQIAKEAYANALLAQKNYARALNIYKQLDVQKLARFADDQAASGNDGIAFEAYAFLDSLEKDVAHQTELRYRMANIKYQSADYAQSRSIVQSALDMPLWKNKNLSYRSTVGVKLRKLMADTCLAMGEPADSARKWLEEAKGFGRDQTEIQEMDLEIARLDILTNNSYAAGNILARITQPKLLESREYLLFLSALLNSQVALADTLMNGYVIKYPASQYANDIIYLMMLTLGLQPQEQGSFFTAVKLLQLNREAGIDTLQTIIAHNNDEELRLLAIEWSIGFSDYGRARELLNHEFEDEVAAEYAELLKLALVNNTAEEQDLAREFLKNKPNSIFSPGFRQRISRLNSSKPNL